MNEEFRNRFSMTGKLKRKRLSLCVTKIVCCLNLWWQRCRWCDSEIQTNFQQLNAQFGYHLIWYLNNVLISDGLESNKLICLLRPLTHTKYLHSHFEHFELLLHGDNMMWLFDTISPIWPHWPIDVHLYTAPFTATVEIHSSNENNNHWNILQHKIIIKCGSKLRNDFILWAEFQLELHLQPFPIIQIIQRLMKAILEWTNLMKKFKWCVCVSWIYTQ